MIELLSMIDNAVGWIVLGIGVIAIIALVVVLFLTPQGLLVLPLISMCIGVVYELSGEAIVGLTMVTYLVSLIGLSLGYKIGYWK